MTVDIDMVVVRDFPKWEDSAPLPELAPLPEFPCLPDFPNLQKLCL
jgi:hypothetical protein